MKWNEMVNANWSRASNNAVSPSATRLLYAHGPARATGHLTS